METAAPVSSSPRTVGEIYKDYTARRAGLVRALTSGTPRRHAPPSSLPLLPFSRAASLFRISRLTPPVRLPFFCLSLLADVDDLYAFCDPGTAGSDLTMSAFLWVSMVGIRGLIGWFGAADKENLCLYGLPNGSWEVSLPAEEVPPEMPEPALGINFARDGMKRRDWLSLVAVHSDAWLVSVAYFFAARLNGNDRYFP
jgi:hypothetical protein